MSINRPGMLNLFPIMAGVLIFAIGAFLLAGGEATKFDEAALGKDTRKVTASFNNVPIQCGDTEDADSCIQGWQARGKRRLSLWLGNSQLYSIQFMKSGDQNAPGSLFRKLDLLGVDLLTFNQPNANLQEHYVLFQYLLHRLDVNSLILPVVFDDTRETGLRDGIKKVLIDPLSVDSLKKTPLGRSLLKMNQSGDAIDDLAGLQDSFQETVETSITTWLEEHSSLWAARKEARGKLLYNLYVFRNYVFDISPQSKRNIIPSRYSLNMSALHGLLKLCLEQGIPVLVYIVPFRSDVASPYVPSEYAKFKSEVEMLAKKHRAEFINLEELVPGEFWGRADEKNNKNSQLDFMHFQTGGHKLLAEAIYKQLVSLKMLGDK